MSLSKADLIAKLPLEEQKAWLETLTVDETNDLARRPWWFIGRPEQQEPEGKWLIWLILTGRGWGKSRTAAEWLVKQVISHPKDPNGIPTEWAVIGETFTDTRIICVEGPAGLLNVLVSHGYIEDIHYKYNKSSYQLVFESGQVIHMLGADDADAGRGLNLSGLWADEIAKWRYSYATWFEGLAFALRIGKRPRAIITTTPKPIKIIKEFLSRQDGSVHVTRGSLYDNIKNLSEVMANEIRIRYEGTRLGRQEIYGEVLDEVEGALWTRTLIERYRVNEAPQMMRVVIGVDPAVTSNELSDTTGIVGAGLGIDGHYYILTDKSVKATPDAWARAAVEAYKEQKADRLVGEGNNGGDMIELLMRQVDPNISYRKVTATRGKMLRAEPISALYEQGRVHHVGYFADLEEQMCEWVPKTLGQKEQKSPDRLDAMVWAMTELTENGSSLLGLAGISVICASCGMPNTKTATICFNCYKELKDVGK